jgi:hypothetical protein
MSSRDIRVLKDDDPTVEEEAPDFDPSSTDQIERPTFVAARETGPGTVEHDERGQARWKWATEHEGASSETEKTFDELEALTNDRLALEEPAGAERAPGPQSGYNPYDTNSPPAPQPARKRR